VNLFKAEPAVVVSLVSAIIALAVSFGLHWSNEQIGAVMAVVTILAGVLIRSQVSPTPPKP
jgi:hypothetical protein